MNLAKKAARERIRQRMIERAEQYRMRTDADGVGDAMLALFPYVDPILVVESIVDQGENFYWVLQSPDVISEIEIPRHRHPGVFGIHIHTIGVDEYRKKRHSRDVVDALEVAIEILLELAEGDRASRADLA